jgi:hypothetical protein
VIPTVADPPPKLGGKEILSQDYQSRALSLLSIASISGCCQVKISFHLHESCLMLSVFVYICDCLSHCLYPKNLFFNKNLFPQSNIIAHSV